MFRTVLLFAKIEPQPPSGETQKKVEMPLFIEWNKPFSSVFADTYNTEDYVGDETEEEWQATLEWADDQERARRSKADSRTKLA